MDAGISAVKQRYLILRPLQRKWLAVSNAAPPIIPSMPSFFMIGTPLCRDVVGPNFISTPNSAELLVRHCRRRCRDSPLGPRLDSGHFRSDKGCLAAIAHSRLS